MNLDLYISVCPKEKKIKQAFSFKKIDIVKMFL